MTDTPRKSSIASRRRGPSSLRIPSGPRRASNPTLSLIFAQGGPALSPFGPPSDTSRQAGTTSSPSEEALFRQLDGDLGGKQMGLRSRRSSSTTVQTVHTLSGARSPDLVAGLREENEEAVVGPSSTQLPPPPVQVEATSDVPRPRSPQRLDPKTSTSWLRWNSPVPAFPGFDKGKRKEDTPEKQTTLSSPGNTSGNPSDSAHSPIETLPSIPLSLDTAATWILAPPVRPPPDPDPGNSKRVDSPVPSRQEERVKPLPGPPTARSRGWWIRSPSEPTKMTAKVVEGGANPSDNASVLPTIGTKDSASIVIPPSSPASDFISPEKSRTSPSSIPPANQLISPPNKEKVEKVENGGGGWQSLLWGSERKGPVASRSESSGGHPSDQTSEIATDSVRESANAAKDRSPDDAGPAGQDPPVQDSASIPSAAPSDLLNKPAGWTTYLYSYVAPSRPAAHPDTFPSHSASHPVQPTSSIADQQPIPVEPPTLSVGPATPRAVSNADSSPERRPSTFGTTGWLNYLAIRSTQKTLDSADAVFSQTSNKDISGRRDVAEREEVMDFSADPEFPSGTGSALSNQEEQPPGVKKGSQALAIRRQRLSNESSRSGGSTNPMPSSPKAQSMLESKVSAAESSSKIASSSSPAAPPQLPAMQPNLVIPTFAATFDRPPRSFLPLQTSLASGPSSQSHGKGLTAATTSLAWKALDVVGGYVYGPPETPRSTSSALTEDEKETRGQKEGRNVGPKLPRRIGLGSGSPDDGWKNVRRVVVVGVHGWFPAKMLNSVFGEPTGTSMKFATMMGQAVKSFFVEKGVEDLRLTLMPLEGEGTIDHRVDKLFKAYLSNPAWINDLRRADAIFFAAHSQGCIVTIHLISRMIAQGHIRTPLNSEAVPRCEWAFGPIGLVPPEEPRRGRRPASALTGADGGCQRVAMLSMCGVHLGPMHSISNSAVIQPYLQWFENAAARELFEFQDTASPVSGAYQRALAMVLENGVRVVLLASLNDQVVPIYGACFSSATHPLLLRALYVGGASFTAFDFMTNLLCFAFLLRNAGIDDQRLIEHLSEATAGSLTGVGHSTPYEEPACYTLAVEYLFHAGPALDPLPPLSIEPFSARDPRNDFELPWIMRALVDSPEIRDLFPGELNDLKEGIGHWRPMTKALRDMKRRLEPMAGKQSRLRPIAREMSLTSLVSAGEVGSALKKDC